MVSKSYVSLLVVEREAGYVWASAFRGGGFLSGTLKAR